MSAISQLMNKSGDVDLALFPTVMNKYKKDLSGWERDISMRGKAIGDVLVENHSLAAYYDQKKAELYTLKEFIKHLMDVRAAEVNEIIKEDSRFDHSDRSIALLINKDVDYILYRRLGMEVTELAQKAAAICTQFNQRSYTLTNITNILQAGLRDVTLTVNDE